MTVWSLGATEIVAAIPPKSQANLVEMCSNIRSQQFLRRPASLVEGRGDSDAETVRAAQGSPLLLHLALEQAAQCAVGRPTATLWLETISSDSGRASPSFLPFEAVSSTEALFAAGNFNCRVEMKQRNIYIPSIPPSSPED